MKCVFILLMIAFHLVYIGDTYPYAKHVVYTFHMPGFLVISGYLFNVGKPLRRFLRSILWIFIPYAIMESGYVLAASVLPIREHIDNLTLPLLLSKLFLNPLGPYWYLHTLMVCGLIYYISDRLSHAIFSRIIGQSVSQSSIPNPQSFPLQSPILNPQSLFIKTYLSPLSSPLSPLSSFLHHCRLRLAPLRSNPVVPQRLLFPCRNGAVSIRARLPFGFSETALDHPSGHTDSLYSRVARQVASCRHPDGLFRYELPHVSLLPHASPCAHRDDIHRTQHPAPASFLPTVHHPCKALSAPSPPP